MPRWSKDDAKRHTKSARTSDKAARAFSHAAESAASRGMSEGAQVRIGNYAAKNVRSKGRSKPRKNTRS